MQYMSTMAVIYHGIMYIYILYNTGTTSEND